MKPLKIILLTVVISLCAVSAQAAGWGLGAVLNDFDHFGLQARKDFPLGGDISEITGAATIFFDNTWFAFDADYHFIINPENPSRFYPLAGIELATDFEWTEFGVNLGGGMDFMMSDTMAAFLEAKWVAWGVNGFIVTFGVKF